MFVGFFLYMKFIVLGDVYKCNMNLEDLLEDTWAVEMVRRHLGIRVRPHQVLCGMKF